MFEVFNVWMFVPIDIRPETVKGTFSEVNLPTFMQEFSLSCIYVLIYRFGLICCIGSVEKRRRNYNIYISHF
jgi:hypothetical protein